VSLPLVANLLPVSTTPVVWVEKFAAGVVDTGAKFATGVVDTSGAPSLANISVNFRKNLNDSNVIFGGLGEDDSWKNLKQKKPHDTVPLKGQCYQSLRKGPTLAPSRV
jgi:hypothetical protein